LSVKNITIGLNSVYHVS